jgi:antitoxin YefM
MAISAPQRWTVSPIIITRDRGKPAAVLMSLEDFASYEET